MASKKRVVTTNKTLYKKLNMLHFNTDVVVDGINEKHLNRIIKNINKQGNVLSVEKLGEYFLIRRTGPLSISIYYGKNNNS